MMSDDSLARRTASGVAWTAVEKWGGRLLTLLVFAILGRLLQPEDFGLVAIVTSILALIAVFVEYGFAQALVQRAKLDAIDVDTAFWLSVGLGGVLYGAICAVSPLIAAAYDEPLMASLLPVGGLVLIFSGLSSVAASTLQRELRFQSLAVRQLSGSVAGATIAITLALAGAGVWALVVQPVAAAAVATIVLWTSVRWRPRLRFSKSSMRSLWPFSAQVVAIELLNAMQANVDKFIVGAFFTPAQLGFYFIAQRVLTILIEVVSSVLSKVSFSVLARVQNDRLRFVNYFTTLTFASACVAFPVFAVFAAFGGPFTRLIFGPGWEASVPLLMLLAPSAALAAVTVFDKSALLAKGKGGTSLWLAFGQFLFGTGILFASVPFGLAAVAAGRSVRQFTFWPIRILILRRAAGIPARAYLRQFLSPSLGAAVIVGVCYGFGFTEWAKAPLGLLSFVLPVSMIALAAYFATVFLIDRSRIATVAAVVRSTRKKES
jgi:teichuronic acid exporter